MNTPTYLTHTNPRIKGVISLFRYALNVPHVLTFTGHTLHLMTVSPTPYHADHFETSYSCLLSNPDTRLLSQLSHQRHILRANKPSESLLLPNDYSTSNNPPLNKVTINLPASLLAQGMYYCEASGSGLTTRVPIGILAYNSKLKNHHFN